MAILWICIAACSAWICTVGQLGDMVDTLASRVKHELNAEQITAVRHGWARSSIKCSMRPAEIRKQEGWRKVTGVVTD